MTKEARKEHFKIWTTEQRRMREAPTSVTTTTTVGNHFTFPLPGDTVKKTIVSTEGLRISDNLAAAMTVFGT